MGNVLNSLRVSYHLNRAPKAKTGRQAWVHVSSAMSLAKGDPVLLAKVYDATIGFAETGAEPIISPSLSMNAAFICAANDPQRLAKAVDKTFSIAETRANSKEPLYLAHVALMSVRENPALLSVVAEKMLAMDLDKQDAAAVISHYSDARELVSPQSDLAVKFAQATLNRLPGIRDERLAYKRLLGCHHTWQDAAEKEPLTMPIYYAALDLASRSGLKRTINDSLGLAANVMGDEVTSNPFNSAVSSVPSAEVSRKAPNRGPTFL